jgi:hypothetical protein
MQLENAECRFLDRLSLTAYLSFHELIWLFEKVPYRFREIGAGRGSVQTSQCFGHSQKLGIWHHNVKLENISLLSDDVHDIVLGDFGLIFAANEIEIISVVAFGKV